MKLTAEEFKEIQKRAQQNAKRAQKLNKLLKAVAEDYALYDFGEDNFVAPLPDTININGKDVTTYIVVFEENIKR
ncbi:MAG: hypothetical protein ABSD89_15265 [Halobacteriota archaeon]|jgi:hypothetical protein